MMYLWVTEWFQHSGLNSLAKTPLKEFWWHSALYLSVLIIIQIFKWTEWHKTARMFVTWSLQRVVCVKTQNTPITTMILIRTYWMSYFTFSSFAFSIPAYTSLLVNKSWPPNYKKDTQIILFSETAQPYLTFLSYIKWHTIKCCTIIQWWTLMLYDIIWWINLFTAPAYSDMLTQMFQSYTGFLVCQWFYYDS